MADKVTLSAAVRSNLLTLQFTQKLVDRTQGRLSTGKAVNSAIDDAVKFFQAKSLSDRAGDLAERKDGIDQGVSTLETVLKATEAIESLLKQMKGIFQTVASQSASERASAGEQIATLAQQIQKLVNDSSYQGLNLINSSTATLTVRFSEKTDSKLDVEGVQFGASALYLDSDGAALDITNITNVATFLSGIGGFTGLLSGFELSNAADLVTFNSRVALAIRNIEQTVANVRSKAATIATNAAILQVRLDFTAEYTNVLSIGADKLTLADTNEEGANLISLQTRQQLGIQALAFAGQAESSILGLFR